jgi:hypothetical protein
MAPIKLLNKIKIFLLFDAKMATQEEMSRYFWSASTNCPPVVKTEIERQHTNFVGPSLSASYVEENSRFSDSVQRIQYLELGVTIASKMLPICTCRMYYNQKCLFHCTYDLMSYTLFYINYLLQ